jgi:hypothetical protein
MQLPAMLKGLQSRRILYSRPRPKTVLILALILVTVYILAFRTTSAGYRVIPWRHEKPEPKPPPTPEELERQKWEQHEQELRDEFKAEYEAAKK